MFTTVLKPGFHLQQTPRPRHKKQSDYVVKQSSFPLIALFWVKIGRCRGRNWLYGNQALLPLQLYGDQAQEIKFNTPLIRPMGIRKVSSCKYKKH